MAWAHSIVRWLVVASACAAIASLLVVRLRGAWDQVTEGLARGYALVITVQLLAGAVLWVTGAWWRSESLFFAWVHPALGIAAAGLAHAGVGRARRALDPRAGATVGLVCLVLSLVLVIHAVPHGAWRP